MKNNIESWVKEKIEKLNIIQLLKEKKHDEIVKNLKQETLNYDPEIDLNRIEILWNTIGIYYLEERKSECAIMLYRELAKILEDKGKEANKHYHKGLPYHNMAVAYLQMGTMEQGRSFLINAFWEDLIKTRGNMNEVINAPAYNVYLNVFGEEPPLPEQVTLTSNEILTIINKLPNVQNREKIDEEIMKMLRTINSGVKEIKEKMEINHEVILEKINSLDNNIQIVILELEKQVNESEDNVRNDFMNLLEELPFIGKPISITRKIMTFVDKHGLTITEKMKKILK